MICRIYKITNNKTSKCYYGSTCQDITKRLKQHEQHYRHYYNGDPHYRYYTALELLGDDDHTIEEVEVFNYKVKTERHDKEREYIVNNECINIKSVLCK